VKTALRIAIAATMFWSLPAIQASDAVYLEDRDLAPREKGAFGEVLVLYIAADGRIVTDAGNPATNQRLAAIFAHWRAKGSEPAVYLDLYPRLKSNSDLKKVRRIVDFLRANRVFQGVIIEDSEARPQKSLL